MTSYPTKIEDANLEMIKTLKKDFSECIIGYSDHTLGPMIPALSICYGSKVVEKHFTFDKKLNTSRDHKLSLNEEGFREMIENIRTAEFSQGQSCRLDFDNEKDGVKYGRCSIVSTNEIPRNTILSPEMLAIKRPGTGISPKFLKKIVGKKIVKDIDADVVLNWNDISI